MRIINKDVRYLLYDKIIIYGSVCYITSSFIKIKNQFLKIVIYIKYIYYLTILVIVTVKLVKL